MLRLELRSQFLRYRSARTNIGVAVCIESGTPLFVAVWEIWNRGARLMGRRNGHWWYPGTGNPMRGSGWRTSSMPCFPADAWCDIAQLMKMANISTEKIINTECRYCNSKREENRGKPTVGQLILTHIIWLESYKSTGRIQMRHRKWIDLPLPCWKIPAWRGWISGIALWRESKQRKDGLGHDREEGVWMGN